ncbi:MAG: hypothetical protein JNK02_07875 [Planctomycetes bacterium]|nr:hypothetical protein [Planctomycetota bacterium]
MLVSTLTFLALASSQSELARSVSLLDESAATLVIEPLRASVAARGSFIARYRASAADGDRVLVLTYQAPDLARLDFQRDASRTSTLFRGSRAWIQTRASDRGAHGEFDLAGFLRAERALTQAFPEAPASGGTPGPLFDLWIAVNPQTSAPGLQARLLWNSTRASPAAWLGSAQAWVGAARRPGSLEKQIEPDGAIVLSLETGFPTELRYPGATGVVRLELEHLALDPVIEADVFAPPRREPGLEPADGAYERHHALSHGESLRARIRALPRSPATFEALTDGELRSRLVLVHTALHGAIVPALHRELVQQEIAATEAQFSFLASAYANSGGDGLPSADERHKADAWRRRLEDKLASARSRLPAGVLAAAPPADDPRFERLRAETEAAAVLAAFDLHVAGAVRHRYDELFEARFGAR